MAMCTLERAKLQLASDVGWYVTSQYGVMFPFLHYSSDISCRWTGGNPLALLAINNRRRN